MPTKASSRIMEELVSVPSDGTSKNYGLNSVRRNTTQKPTYAEIVGKIGSTARRKSDQ